MTAVLLSLPVNAVLPCGSPSAARRHLSLGEVCVRCEPDVEWSSRCPGCQETVRVVGGRFVRHIPENSTVKCTRSEAVDQRPRARVAR